MREDSEDRARRYLATTTDALKHLRTRKPPGSITTKQVDQVLEMVTGYVRDAKHYADNKKPVTSLACIAYAEGLLDARFC